DFQVIGGIRETIRLVYAGRDRYTATLARHRRLVAVETVAEGRPIRPGLRPAGPGSDSNIFSSVLARAASGMVGHRPGGLAPPHRSRPRTHACLRYSCRAAGRGRHTEHPHT